jgi:hypothetical protein
VWFLAGTFFLLNRLHNVDYPIIQRNPMAGGPIERPTEADENKVGLKGRQRKTRSV